MHFYLNSSLFSVAVMKLYVYSITFLNTIFATNCYIHIYNGKHSVINSAYNINMDNVYDLFFLWQNIYYRDKGRLN